MHVKLSLHGLKPLGYCTFTTYLSYVSDLGFWLLRILNMQHTRSVCGRDGKGALPTFMFLKPNHLFV